MGAKHLHEKKERQKQCRKTRVDSWSSFLVHLLDCPFMFFLQFVQGLIIVTFIFSIQVVTCGSIPLESSFQKVPRCVYVSTELYEYRGWGRKSANPKHRFFSWGCRHVEVSFCHYSGMGLLLLKITRIVS